MTALNTRTAMALLAVLVAVGAPRLAHAQQMNFSYYTDVGLSSDGQTIYTTVSGLDNSTGCTHYNYSTTGVVSGPGGYYDQQNFSGLSTYMNAPFAEGDWYASSNAVVDCSCFGSGLGAGGGWDPFSTGAFVANYYYDGSVTMAGATVWRYTRCTPGICEKWYTPPDPTPPPAFLRIPMTWTQIGTKRVCASVLQQVIASCNG